MQSRLATAAISITKSNRLLTGIPRIQALPSRFVTILTGKAADPAIHAVNPEETNDASEAAKAAEGPTSSNSSSSETGVDPYEMPKSLHPASSPKIQSTGVKKPIEPITQQKRRASSANALPSLSDVTCAGLDGSPWPDDDRKDRREERKDQEEDDKEYYEHHKASPLSEIEIADSRKPITKATDGTADSKFSDYGTGGVLLWRPEQIDTAEDSLLRAMEIWKENATRGDPDSPHGRVLRTLRGEYW